MYESGIAKEVYTKAAERVVPQTGADVKPSTTFKIKNQVEVEESDFFPVRYKNVIVFFRSFYSMILFSFAILAVELILKFFLTYPKAAKSEPKIRPKMKPKIQVRGSYITRVMETE